MKIINRSCFFNQINNINYVDLYPHSLLARPAKCHFISNYAANVLWPCFLPVECIIIAINIFLSVFIYLLLVFCEGVLFFVFVQCLRV